MFVAAVLPGGERADDGLRRCARVRCARRATSPTSTPGSTPISQSSSSGTVGNTLGAVLGWAIGYYGGHPLLERYGRSCTRLPTGSLARSAGSSASARSPCHSGSPRRSSGRSWRSRPGSSSGRFAGSSPLAAVGCLAFSAAVAGIGWAVGSSWHTAEPRPALRRLRRRRGGARRRRRTGSGDGAARVRFLPMTIPHIDVRAQYAPLIPELKEAFARTLETRPVHLRAGGRGVRARGRGEARHCGRRQLRERHRRDRPRARRDGDRPGRRGDLPVVHVLRDRRGDRATAVRRPCSPTSTRSRSTSIRATSSGASPSARRRSCPFISSAGRPSTSAASACR